MSPGPSMLVVVNNALKSKLSGIMASIGHGFGIGIYALFAVIGLEFLTHNYSDIFIVLKISSITFLFYIGIISILKNQEKISNKRNLDENRSAFVEGFAIAILNPKILFFFCYLFPIFIFR